MPEHMIMFEIICKSKVSKPPANKTKVQIIRYAAIKNTVVIFLVKKINYFGHVKN